MRIKFILLSLFTIWTSLAFSQDQLKVAFGDALAPWVMPETNEGILLDIITDTLEPAGYDISNVYYPYARRILSYRQGLVDVVSDVNPALMREKVWMDTFRILRIATLTTPFPSNGKTISLRRLAI